MRQLFLFLSYISFIDFHWSVLSRLYMFSITVLISSISWKFFFIIHFTSSSISCLTFLYASGKFTTTKLLERTEKETGKGQTEEKKIWRGLSYIFNLDYIFASKVSDVLILNVEPALYNHHIFRTSNDHTHFSNSKSYFFFSILRQPYPAQQSIGIIHVERDE